MKAFMVDIGFACFGFETENGIVVNIAPIAKYAMGWAEERALRYFRSRGTVVEI